MQPTSTHDALVIGSGFGGALAAARLADGGLRVALLERGPWRDTIPVRSMGIADRAPLPRGQQAWRNLFRAWHSRALPGGSLVFNARGLFELHTGKGLNVICASGVGGGSHVYAGLNFAPPDPAYWDGIAADLSSAGMAPHYASVTARLGSRAPLADDQIPNTLEERFRGHPRLDTAQADYTFAMGLLLPETPGQPRRVINADGVERMEMQPGEDGNLGSFHGGKTTLDFAYLARALKQGLIVRDLHEVMTIAREARAYVVRCTDLRTRRPLEYRAARVLVAAGALNTLRLLLRSRADGALTGMPALGRHFGGNGDYFGYWDLRDDTRDLSQGLPAHGPLRLRAGDPLASQGHWPLIAEGSLPDGRDLPLGQWIKRKLRSGTYVAGMGADAQDGRVHWHKGRLKIDYDPAGSPLFADIRRAFAALGEASGHRVWHFVRPTTVHPTGGACIGETPDSGVVDARGEVHGLPGLYVVDAAALPKPVGGPPSLSIAAWAEHVAQGILATVSAHVSQQPESGERS